MFNCLIDKDNRLNFTCGLTNASTSFIRIRVKMFVGNVQIDLQQ